MEEDPNQNQQMLMKRKISKFFGDWEDFCGPKYSYKLIDQKFTESTTFCWCE